jgi:hypothetical protein
MTDRFHSLTVVLEADIREDDVDGIVAAIHHLRGVSEVGKNVRGLEAFVYESRARNEVRQRIAEILWPVPKGDQR